jgi:hypothetical protein
MVGSISVGVIRLSQQVYILHIRKESVPQKT